MSLAGTKNFFAAAKDNSWKYRATEAVKRQNVAHIYGVKLAGFVAWFLWRGIYLAKLPTFSRKLEVAMNRACAIPFPPNIVQFWLSKVQSAEADGEREETNGKHKGES